MEHTSIPPEQAAPSPDDPGTPRRHLPDRRARRRWLVPPRPDAGDRA